MSWFTQLPHRLEMELDAFRQVGVVAIPDENSKRNGVLTFDIRISNTNTAFDLPDGTTDLILNVTYPDLYPKFRPWIKAPALNLARHQNPIEKHLCLLGRRTENWEPETTACELLQKQLKKVLIKGSTNDATIIKNDETEQAEPFAEIITCPQNGILINKTFLKQISEGSTCRKLCNLKIGLPESKQLPTQMAVVSMDLESEVYKVPDIIMKTYIKVTEGVLYYINEKPPADVNVTLKWLRDKLKNENEKFHLPNKNIQLGTSILHNVIGLVFPDETEKGGSKLNLLFLIDMSFTVYDKNSKIRRDLPPRFIKNYIRALNIGSTENLVRVPQLRNVDNKKIGVFGLGALGGFAALELARNMIGELRVLDGDVVDNETSVRWPLGTQYAGWNKAEAIKDFIDKNYPTTTCIPFVHTIGLSVGINEQSFIENILDGLSLVIDATAETGVHHYLSIEAKNKGIPYICISATPGGYGGLIIRTIPGKSNACWKCFKFWQSEEGKEDLYPRSNETDGWIQPAGCADVTFTGTSFDLQQIVLQGVRLAISTVCRGDDMGYKDFNWDIAVLNLFDEHGEPIIPEWKTFDLTPHKDCDHK